ncbi:transglycosylase SLT domain-containing protein [Methylocella sp.]|uniref:transglycosylase SLT domain-containing protein n=1 Tax=Methylocella sp. TaxID=1978226 RepID=UPI0037834F72
MRRIRLGSFAVALSCCALAGASAFAQDSDRDGSGKSSYDAFIAAQAKKHGLPERLIHRVVKRESGYNPRLVSRACYGLMQIKHATARSMGYKGDARGLLDPFTNMTYAIPYLANAYRVAGGNEDRAVSLYASGFYYTAKRAGKLDEMRTAESAPLVDSPAPQPVATGAPGLLAFLAGGAPRPAPAADFPSAAAPAAQAIETAAPGTEAVPAQTAALAQATAEPPAETQTALADVPLPPERPESLSTQSGAQASLRRNAQETRRTAARQRAAAAAIAALPDDMSWSAAQAMQSN